MARYARLENGVAVELIDTGEYAITQLYAPAFVEAMVQVPEGMHVEIGAPVSELRHEVEPLPVTGNPVVIPVTVVEEQAPLTAARTWRQSSLSATEWWVTRHRDEQALGRGTTLKPAQYLQLLEYRQALRDWPDSSQFPSSVSRPSAPDWLAADAG
ncbi:phage tail assembly chaperone [Pseudomonas granadensis]|uniref:phage tail assembly chaperone n=1 Tax=Pseudomonas granadensis TaxID=1421430 RepID=UPI00087DED03|nr:phage tail assembly chaperone [Pseudomonas granadensis]SDS47819.1 Phage tail assembly chaperone protein [Pseudomonas granadensis]